MYLKIANFTHNLHNRKKEGETKSNRGTSLPEETIAATCTYEGKHLKCWVPTAVKNQKRKRKLYYGVTECIYINFSPTIGSESSHFIHQLGELLLKQIWLLAKLLHISVSQSTTFAQTELSPRLQDGSAWIMLAILKFPGGYILMNLVSPSVLLQCHSEVHILVYDNTPMKWITLSSASTAICVH